MKPEAVEDKSRELSLLVKSNINFDLTYQQNDGVKQ